MTFLTEGRHPARRKCLEAQGMLFGVEKEGQDDMVIEPTRCDNNVGIRGHLWGVERVCWETIHKLTSVN